MIMIYYTLSLSCQDPLYTSPFSNENLKWNKVNNTNLFKISDLWY